MKIPIFDKLKNRSIDADLLEINKPGSPIKIVKISIDNQIVGEMFYSINKESIEILKMHNFQQGRYGQIGTSLVDFAFGLSMNYGKSGKITLKPLDKSVVFWQKMGFEFKDDKLMMYLPEKKIEHRMNSDALKAAKKWPKLHGLEFKLFEKDLDDKTKQKKTKQDKQFISPKSSKKLKK